MRSASARAAARVAEGWQRARCCPPLLSFIFLACSDTGFSSGSASAFSNASRFSSFSASASCGNAQQKSGGCWQGMAGSVARGWRGKYVCKWRHGSTIDACACLKGAACWNCRRSAPCGAGLGQRVPAGWQRGSPAPVEESGHCSEDYHMQGVGLRFGKSLLSRRGSGSQQTSAWSAAAVVHDRQGGTGGGRGRDSPVHHDTTAHPSAPHP